MERYEWHFDGDYSAEYSELTGRVMAFGPEGYRRLVGFARTAEEDLKMAREWFGGSPPRRTDRYYISLNVFPFP